MRLICGIIAVRRKAKPGKEDKVSQILDHFLVACHVPLNAFGSPSNPCSDFKPFPCCLSCSTSIWMLFNSIMWTSVYLGKPSPKNFPVGSQSYGSLLVVI